MNEHLYRSRDDRMIAGVAGGLAEMWDADPSLIRIVWVILAFLTGGIAVLVYIVMAIVVPEDLGQPTSNVPPGAPPAGPGAAGPAAAGSAPPVDRREARRAARAARRASRRDGSAGIVVGILLIAIGGLFLVRQFLPALDFDWFWPLVLVGLGVVLLAAGLSRDSGRGPGPTS